MVTKDKHINKYRDPTKFS